MNSIEIAKKLIEENNTVIEEFRRKEEIIRTRIEEYTHDVKRYEALLAASKRALEMAEEDLQSERDARKVGLVENLALKMFIAESGGLDMLD